MRGPSAKVLHHDAPELQRDPCFLFGSGVGGEESGAWFPSGLGALCLGAAVLPWTPDVCGRLSWTGCGRGAGDSPWRGYGGTSWAPALGSGPRPSRPWTRCKWSFPALRPAAPAQASRHPDIGGSGSLPKALGDHLAVGND